MGRATILSDLGDGLYRVRMDFGKSRQQYLVGLLDMRLDFLSDMLPELQDALADAESDYDAMLADLDIAIEALRTARASGGDGLAEHAALTQISVDLAEGRKIIARAKFELSRVETEIADKSAQRARIYALETERDLDVWCADYTIGVTPGTPVETMEIPGEAERIIIRPLTGQFDSMGGFLLMRELQTPHQLFFNAAILPGWQKFQPTYRIAEVTAVNDDGETVNVEIDASIRSSAQELGINLDDDLNFVPANYMGGGNGIYEVGDRVVVQFVGQNQKSPRVVGFEKEPRAAAFATSVNLVGDQRYDYRFELSDSVMDAILQGGISVKVSAGGTDIPMVGLLSPELKSYNFYMEGRSPSPILLWFSKEREVGGYVRNNLMQFFNNFLFDFDPPTNVVYEIIVKKGAKTLVQCTLRGRPTPPRVGGALIKWDGTGTKPEYFPS